MRVELAIGLLVPRQLGWKEELSFGGYLEGQGDFVSRLRTHIVSPHY